VLFVAGCFGSVWYELLSENLDQIMPAQLTYFDMRVKRPQHIPLLNQRVMVGFSGGENHFHLICSLADIIRLIIVSGYDEPDLALPRCTEFLRGENGFHQNYGIVISPSSAGVGYEVKELEKDPRFVLAVNTQIIGRDERRVLNNGDRVILWGMSLIAGREIQYDDVYRNDVLVGREF
jgi:hypothetical protein